MDFRTRPHLFKCFQFILPLFTLLVCSLFAGFKEGILGPSLPDLQHLTSSTVTTASTIFTWGAVAAIPGSFLIGQWFDTFDGMAVMVIILIPAAIFTTLIPWCPELIGVGIIHGLASFFINGIITGTYTLPFNSNWTQGDIILQVVRLTFTLGLAIAPITISPFLLKQRDDQSTSKTTAFKAYFANTSTDPMQGATMKDDLQLFWAFLISGLGFVVAALLCSSVYIYNRTAGPSGYDKIEDTNANRKSSKQSLCMEISSLCRDLKLVTFLGIIFFIIFAYAGIEMFIGGLLVTFLETWVQWSVSDSVVIVSVFHVIKVVGAAVVLPISGMLHPEIILLVDTILLVIGSLLLLFTFNVVKVMVWVAIVVIGLGCGSFYPTALLVTQKQVFISGKISGLMNVAFIFGMMTFPPLGGHLMDTYGTYSFPICLLVIALIGALLCIVAIVMSRKRRNSLEKVDHTDIEVEEDSGQHH